MNALSRTITRDTDKRSTKTAHTYGFIKGFAFGIVTVIGAIAAWIAWEAS